MEKSRLCTDLQNIVDQFSKFRTKYSTLKAHCTAQEELIRLQKIELDTMNLQVKELVAATIEYKQHSNVMMHHLEMENRRLQKIVNKPRDDNETYDLQTRLENEAQIRKLHDELMELRSNISAEIEKYQNEIDSLKKTHEEEIATYRKKLKLYEILDESCSDQIFMTKNNVKDKKKGAISAHPALDDVTECKKKKPASSAPRWPQLDVTIKRDVGATINAISQPKKRKLYQMDREAVVDLTLLN